jgi:23S rRNA (uracil1939-C5)-methyltransferase
MLTSMVARVKLQGMAYGGAAVGRLDDGAAVFVPGALEGELAEIDVVERKKNFARGRLLEVLEPAAARIEPPCPHFFEGCGGCQWQHASYDAQLRYKQQIVADQLRRMGGIADPILLDPVPSPNAFGYRNTAEFHIDNGAIGFHREGSHQLVDIVHCPLVEPPLDAALGVLRKSLSKLEALTSVHVRLGADAVQIALLSDEDPRAYKVLAGELGERVERALGLPVHVAGVRAGSDRMRGLHGEPWVYMPLAGRRFRVSALSFFQVNSAVAEVLAQRVTEQVRSGDRILDLFSGVGTFSLLAADEAGEVVGVESHPAGIADAAANLAEAGAENAHFVHSDVSSAAALAAEHWDLAILDPPRSGCPPSVLNALEASRLAYVSCDPSTLARDLKLLLARGFTLESVQFLDMFPQTYHIETLALLTRREHRSSGWREAIQ